MPGTTLALAVAFTLHGVIHLLGFAKAFTLLELSALTAPISRSLGLLWLLAGVLLIASAVVLFVAPERLWLLAIPALALSQLLIVSAWSSAKLGTLLNVILVVPTVFVALEARSASFRSRFDAETAEARRQRPSSALVTEAELSKLPEPVQEYVRRSGAVGKPHVTNLRASFRGRLRASPGAGWMTFRAEQQNFFRPGARWYLIDASMYGLPVSALHRYAGAHATMQVKVFSLISVVDARGPEMDRSETVTMLNDLCVLAPAALIDAGIEWRSLGADRVEARFVNASHAVSAVLVFDERGDLVNFYSDDRYQSADGKTFRLYRWSTPLRDYLSFDGRRVASRGEAVWDMPDGELVYGEFELTALEYNVSEGQP